MNQTILITGTSSGFGAAAVHFFAEKGWNVIATMRDISKAGALQHLDNVFVTPLDVQDPVTIANAVNEGIARFGTIDVVVNNAGYGLFGIFETASPEAVRTQFEVNVFGVMEVIRAILPHFRAKKSGTIINVSSGAGAVGFPMASIYSSSKFALEGLSEGLRYELGSLGIKVKIIEPGGALQTSFINRMGGESSKLQQIEDYLPFLTQIGEVFGGMAQAADVDAVERVIAAIYEAATDGSDQLRYAPTSDIQGLLNARRSTSEEEYQQFTSGFFLKK